MKRYALVLASALALSAGLAGCGSSGTSGSSSSGPQTVKLITWQNPPAVKVLKKIDTEFHQKYPNITVEYQTAANTAGGYQTMQQTAIKSDSADLMGILPFEPLPKHPTTSNESGTQLWATHNQFLALNGQPWVKNFSKTDEATASYNGKVYGLVTGVYQYGVFYNKAIFAKYHLSVPTTYNQFIHVDQVLKSHGVTPLFVGLQNVGPVYLQFIWKPLMQEVWGTALPHGTTLNAALWNGQTKWTSQKFIEVLKRTKQVMQYLEPNFAGVPWESMPGDFANGKAAMLLDGSWDLPSVQHANPKLQVGFFPFPGSNNASNNTPTTQGDLTFAVLANAKDKNAALKWLNFFAQPKIYAQYVNATGISPSLTKGTFHSYSSQVLGTWFGKGESINNLPALPTTGPYWDQTTNFPTAIMDMYQGKYTPNHVAKMYQSGWPQVIK